MNRKVGNVSDESCMWLLWYWYRFVDPYEGLVGTFIDEVIWSRSVSGGSWILFRKRIAHARSENRIYVNQFHPREFSAATG